MKAIVELTDEELARYSAIHANLLERTKDTSREDWFVDIKQKSGYAHYTFSGTVSGKLIELLGRMPTEVEIIMLIDSGFSHFGASCSIYDKTFSGRVNTD